MKCGTCLHYDICRRNSIPVFGMDSVACQYEVHELVGEWIENTRYRRKYNEKRKKVKQDETD